MHMTETWGHCCSLYNNVKPPSWLNPGTDLQLFKDGIEPKWEDPMCENGGKWTVQIPKAPNSKATLDAYWLNAVCLYPNERHVSQGCLMVCPNRNLTFNLSAVLSGKAEGIALQSCSSDCCMAASDKRFVMNQHLQH